ncbi:Sorbitol dehydrogenase [Thalictrum thalictroides]|uniref:Sorbitol dehydrogenase n=1 Tax=Thalictrum thalictroides TaxID=46969 RepID=A0A7J6VZE2_THATH|nr:Sorbitol dehydrogenase [Thalictrum thalictroides]
MNYIPQDIYVLLLCYVVHLDNVMTKFFATPPIHESLANQVVHSADLCFKLSDNMSLEEGAMCEPLSVGVHVCHRANVNAETNVLILGAGPIGLVTMLTARA